MRPGAVESTWLLLTHLSWVFLKTGFVFFGGGFLLIPLLHRELVVHTHWLTAREFVDGVALSQLTPGPVAILATFCGYRMGGVTGAIVATVFVFMPAFVLMVVLSGMYGRVEQFPLAREVLSVFPPAIVGMLVATAWEIGRPVALSPWRVFATLVSFLAMVRFRVNPALLIVAGALIGWIMGAR